MIQNVSLQNLSSMVHLTSSLSNKSVFFSLPLSLQVKTENITIKLSNKHQNNDKIKQKRKKGIKMKKTILFVHE